MNDDPVDNLCSAAAADLGDGEIKSAAIIASLLPMLLALPCFQSRDDADPKAAIAEHYDDDTDEFDPRFVASLRRQTRRAAKLEGYGRMNSDRLDEYTRATLRHTMRADDGDVVAYCMSHQ